MMPYPMSDTVFYSWQSDLPNCTNRGFIEDALKKAVKAIRNDDSIEVEPVVDRDTLGIGGSPDIASTIFDKIENAKVFVCDITFINPDAPEKRLTPNPNVLLELGYALKVLGVHRIIMVMNTAFGKIENLPFDLRMKRVMSYTMIEDNLDRATERNKLSGMLESGLRTIFEGLSRDMPGEIVKPLSRGDQATQTAYEVLHISTRLRDILLSARSPMTPDWEISAGKKMLEEANISIVGKTDEQLRWQYRWKPVHEANSELGRAALDAEVYFGSEARSLINGLQTLVSHFWIDLDMYLKLSHSQMNLNGFDPVMADFIRKVYNSSDEDEFEQKVRLAVQRIGDYMRPRI